jgi:hypothetical protein
MAAHDEKFTSVNGHGGTRTCNMPPDEKAELIEKIRVLNCLYQISELVVDGTNAFQKTLQAIIDLVPQAFEYPEKVAAAILLGETRYQSPGFTTVKVSVQKSIVVNSEVRGQLEIGCMQDGSFALSAAGTCTIEENKLLEAVSQKNRLHHRAERGLGQKENPGGTAQTCGPFGDHRTIGRRNRP